MNRHITIEWPYDQIVLEFKPEHLRKQPAPLRPRQWDALKKAEKRIYHTDPGCHGWTDVMPNEGDELLNKIWEQVSMYIENDLHTDSVREEDREAYVLHKTASRVAQTIAVMTFGPEVLINS